MRIDFDSMSYHLFEEHVILTRHKPVVDALKERVRRPDTAGVRPMVTRSSRLTIPERTHPMRSRFWMAAVVQLLWIAAPEPVDAQAVAHQYEKPAWVVGDVPDTVWILMEAAVESDDEDAMKAMLRDAEALARTATVGHEDNIGRRFALAAVLGMRADREGGRTKVHAASALYDELDVVLELDNEHASARYMMGRLHAGVRRMNRVTRWLATNLLGGSTLKQATWSEAERHLVFAEARAPTVPDHHLQLARLFYDTDRPQLAKTELEHVLALTATSPMELEARAEAIEFQTELLDELEGS